ncbi:hypothetical protein BH24ACT3_BH24ACT3_09760 [soil metagenome]
MLASITPLGERGRHNRYGFTVATFLIGSLAGGAALGAALGAAGHAARLVLLDGVAPTAAVLGLFAAVAALGLAADLGAGGLRLPTIRRQVNENWLDDYRGWVVGVGFGFQLGLGVVTIVTASATYVAFAAALLSLSWVGGLVIGATFGLARALPVLATARVHHPDALRSLHRRTQRLAAPVHRTVLGVQGATVVTTLLMTAALVLSVRI